MTKDAVVGCRILVVEDEMLIAMEIEETLNALECEIVATTGRLDEALALAGDSQLDCAILDVNIRGGEIFPIAEKLLERNIPFVFASGYGNWALPEAFRDTALLSKPYTPAELEEKVRLMCAEKASQ